MSSFDPSIPVPDPAAPPYRTPEANPPAAGGPPDDANRPAGDGAASTEVVEVGGGRSRPRRVSGPSRFSLILAVIVAGSALFIGGYTLGAHVATTPGTPASEESRFAPFWDVYSAIQNEYAGSPRPSADQLVQAAINGMMQSLNDPWSYYQGPTDFQNALLNVGGQAVGIGVQVELQPVDPTSKITCQAIGNGCELAIVQPIPDSPAEAAGIQPGDVIDAVDGTSLNGLTIDQASTKIKGTVNTTVTLTIDRNGTKVDVSIVRAVFNQPEVVTKTYDNDVAYIAIGSGINPPASSQFHLALQTALKAGRRNIIIDLRGNPGGYVDDAVKIASEFIGSGTLVYQQDAAGTQTEIGALQGGLATDPSIKVVVLVDKGTASAAEIISAALQGRNRAKLIGVTTYGKGVVQEWLPLANNYGGIHLTIARWLTPAKVWIQGKGLTPDMTVSSDGARAGVDPVLNAALVQLGFTALPAPLPEPSASPTPAATPSSGATPSPVPSK
jgi:carboxyl-terminal processing protease